MTTVYSNSETCFLLHIHTYLPAKSVRYHFSAALPAQNRQRFRYRLTDQSDN